jgi:hypothetical protein
VTGRRQEVAMACWHYSFEVYHASSDPLSWVMLQGEQPAMHPKTVH